MTWLSDTIVLHSSRSCAIFVHSATDDPIQSLMSSVHRLLGRPCRFLSLIQPWRTAVHTLSPCAQKLQFLSLNVLQKSRFFSDFFQNGLVCSCSFQLIRNMRRYDVISKALILFLSLAFKVHVSHPYVATGHTSNLIKRALITVLLRTKYVRYLVVNCDQKHLENSIIGLQNSWNYFHPKEWDPWLNVLLWVTCMQPALKLINITAILCRRMLFYAFIMHLRIHY